MGELQEPGDKEAKNVVDRMFGRVFELQLKRLPYDIYFPTEPDLSKIWKFVKNLVKNYISENLIKKHIDIFAAFKITKKILKNCILNTICTASRCNQYF